MLRRLLVALLVGVLGVAVSAVPARAISGGATVDPGWVQFVVKIDIGGEHPRACTGGLVDRQWAVTAASCFAEGDAGTVRPGRPASPTTATVGRPDLATTGGQIIPVDRVVPHPVRDVALVRLALVATSGSLIAVSAAAPSAGESLAASGYGRTDDTWVPDELEARAVSVANVTGGTFGIVGHEDETTPADEPPFSACQGDAGGPVARPGASGGQPELVGLLVGSGHDGCLEEPTAAGTGSTVVRLDGLGDWIDASTPGYRSGFLTTYLSSPHPTRPGLQAGIGGFDFHSAYDQAVPFDFDHSGKQDHLLMYRPGSNIVIISRLVTGDPRDPADDRYAEVFRSDQGIGGATVANVADRIVPFDYDHDGLLDELVVYRPGTERVLTVVTHGKGTSFTTAYSTPWSILSADVQVLAYDFDRNGKMDDLLAYRPGGNQVTVITKGAGAAFVDKAPIAQGALPGYTLTAADRIVAFDFEHTGKADDLFVYRPGESKLTVFTRGTGATFTKTFETSWWMFGSANAHAIAYDYDHDGRSDDILAYRSGESGHHSIISKGSGAGFEDKVPITAGTIGGYDLAVASDRIVAFDAEHVGSRTNLLAYRPRSGIAWVMDRADPPLGGTAPVQRPLGEESLVEEFAYPGAARILDELGVELISGDGHIVLDEGCVVQPDENGVGSMRVMYTIESGGRRTLCLAVLADSGRIDLMIPSVYSIRGDGYEPNAGHDFVARIDTRSGPVVEIEGESDTYNPVGIGADPDSEPTTLLQIRVP